MTSTPPPAPLKLPALLLKDLAGMLGSPPARLHKQLLALDGSAAGHLTPTLTLPGGRTAVSRAGARHLLQSSGKLPSAAACLAFINLKGGVGKTTLAVNLAARASQCGLRVCLLDLDPQASATLALAGEPAEGTPVFLDLWASPEALAPALWPVAPGLDLLPSSLDNTLLDAQLAHPGQQKKAVRSACQQLAALGYDLVLIDCPPALGTAVISTFCAVDQLVIPVCADAFSLKGLRLTLEEMAAISDTFALPAPRARLLFNRHDRRERLHDHALAGLRSHPEHGRLLMRSVLRVSSQYARALAERQSIYADNRQSVASSDLDACLGELLDWGPPGPALTKVQP